MIKLWVRRKSDFELACGIFAGRWEMKHKRFRSALYGRKQLCNGGHFLCGRHRSEKSPETLVTWQGLSTTSSTSPSQIASP